MDDLVKRLSGIADALADLFPEFSKDINSATDRIEQLKAALNRIAMEDAKLDEPALWIDDNTPLGLFIDMTLGEKKDD